MPCKTAASGMALVTVLWLVALLTILATAAVTVSVTQARSAQRYLQAAQADLTLDAAIRVVLLRLLTPEGKGPGWPIDPPEPLNLLDDTVRVTVQREVGRIDLNSAEPDLLLALLAANGWPEAEARLMSMRILAWRDSDVELTEQDAQLREYESAQLNYGPRHGPFQSVDELRQVLGGERLSGEILDALTVFTHTTVCVQAAAPAAAKRALSWADQHRLGGHRWSHDPDGAGPPPRAHLAGLAGEVLRLIACGSGEGVAHCREAVVRLTGSDATPFQVFEWRTIL